MFQNSSFVNALTSKCIQEKGWEYIGTLIETGLVSAVMCPQLLTILKEREDIV